MEVRYDRATLVYDRSDDLRAESVINIFYILIVTVLLIIFMKRTNTQVWVLVHIRVYMPGTFSKVSCADRVVGVCDRWSISS